MSQEELILKIEEKIPKSDTFEKRIIYHIQKEYFPLIYQCLYERIMPADHAKFSTEEFKELLLKNNYLELLNDIYRTRLSKGAFPIISERLEEVKDFDDYKNVLKQFEGCNPRKNRKANAFSFGTKVLHTYNPEENPILDSVIRDNLGITYQLDIDLCVNFKKAMNRFANKHEEYFLFENNNRIKDEFKKFHLKPKFPKMKILDMALYHKKEDGTSHNDMFAVRFAHKNAFGTSQTRETLYKTRV